MVKKSPVGKHIHYESLTRPIGSAELHTFRQEQLPKSSRVGRMVGYWIVGGAFGIWSLITLIVAIVERSVAGALGSMLPVVIAGVIIVGMVAAFRRADMMTIRLWRFAIDNGWQYARSVVNPTHQGMIFQQGHSRKAEHLIYKIGSPDEATFEIGSHQYTVGSGKNQRTYYWTYTAIELDRHVPHMVLDAKSNNARFFGKSFMSNLPASFRRDQVISLEGDFDKYFTLYAPEQYKRDAYYVFTPDLMALLIDHSHQFDAEVVDNKLFIYSPRSGKLLDPNFLYQLLSIIHTVGMKVHSQTDYYADEHTGDRAVDAVASHGRRLRHGVSWGAIIIAVLVILINILPMFFE